MRTLRHLKPKSQVNGCVCSLIGAFRDQLADAPHRAAHAGPGMDGIPRRAQQPVAFALNEKAGVERLGPAFTAEPDGQHLAAPHHQPKPVPAPSSDAGDLIDRNASRDWPLDDAQRDRRRRWDQRVSLLAAKRHNPDDNPLLDPHLTRHGCLEALACAAPLRSSGAAWPSRGLGAIACAVLNIRLRNRTLCREGLAALEHHCWQKEKRAQKHGSKATLPPLGSGKPVKRLRCH